MKITHFFPMRNLCTLYSVRKSADQVQQLSAHQKVHIWTIIFHIYHIVKNNSII